MKVLDASVVAKLFLKETDSEKVEAIFNNTEELVVPDILFVEMANTLATKASVSVDQIERGLDLVYGLKMRVEDIGKRELVAAAKMAKHKGTAVYDMIYAVLARKFKAKLITADKNFALKTGFKFVKVL